MFKEIELEEAQEILLGTVKKLKVESDVLENTCGKVLAEDVYAPLNVPGFPRSPFDGFALRAWDTKGASPQKPVKIKIIDEIRAGDIRQIRHIPLGCGVKILTGAPLPGEADVVVKKEDVDYLNGEITIIKELEKDSNVIFNGSELQKGEKVFAKGEVIGPYQIGVLSALGLEKVSVYQVPKIGLISTGNELRSPGQSLEYGQIYNSNIYTLEALINSRGGQAFKLGIVPDDEKKISAIIDENLKNYDVLITTGGASVGDYDLIEKVLRAENWEILFNRVKIKPGAPVVCAVWEGKIIIGLSGNPAAALISFELLVRPLLKKLRGISDGRDKYLDVEFLDGFPQKSTQRRFLRVRVSWEDEKWVARMTGQQRAGILKSMVGCNALLDIPRGSGPLAPKTKVKVLLLEEDFLCYHR